MVGQSEAFVSPLRWLDGDSGAKAGSRRDESHLPVELSPGTSSSVSRGFATTVSAVSAVSAQLSQIGGRPFSAQEMGLGLMHPKEMRAAVIRHPQA